MSLIIQEVSFRTIHRKQITPAVYGIIMYHLRHNDDGEFFAIEKSVAVNHAGSIVTKEPIDLKSKGYIVLDEDSSPNFLGENMSLYEFREYNPDQTEELSMGMTEV